MDRDVPGSLMRRAVMVVGGAEVWVDTEAHVYPPWVAGETVAVDDRRAHLDVAYECVQGHVTQADWEPQDTPALWTPVRERFAPWVAPTGSHDAYPSGVQVEHDGAFWTSTRDANVWEPGTTDSGWEVTDDRPRVTRLGLDGSAAARVIGGGVDVRLDGGGQVDMPGERGGWPDAADHTVSARWPA